MAASALKASTGRIAPEGPGALPNAPAEIARRRALCPATWASASAARASGAPSASASASAERWAPAPATSPAELAAAGKGGRVPAAANAPDPELEGSADLTLRAPNYYPQGQCDVFCEGSSTCGGFGECNDEGACLCFGSRSAESYCRTCLSHYYPAEEATLILGIPDPPEIFVEELREVEVDCPGPGEDDDNDSDDFNASNASNASNDSNGSAGESQGAW
ncbi:unnamed protein product [Effrenium voratum]|nr:unnamed protein product [Effrenium voratum]